MSETFESESDLEDDLTTHIYKRCHIEKINELEKYLGEGNAPPKTNILTWWKVIN